MFIYYLPLILKFQKEPPLKPIVISERRSDKFTNRESIKSLALIPRFSNPLYKLIKLMHKIVQFCHCFTAVNCSTPFTLKLSFLTCPCLFNSNVKCSFSSQPLKSNLLGLFINKLAINV